MSYIVRADNCSEELDSEDRRSLVCVTGSGLLEQTLKMLDQSWKDQQEGVIYYIIIICYTIWMN